MTNAIGVGEMMVLAVSDGRFSPRATWFMPGVPSEEWERYRAEHLNADGRMSLNLGSYVVRTGGRTILVDTGIGERSIGPFAAGSLLTELQSAGVRPEEIDLVLITHMHLDHIGWNTTERDGVRQTTFPRARYLIQRREWEYWTADADSRNLMERCALPVEQAGQLDLVEPDHEPLPGVTLISTPGHTPGHCCILLRSGSEGAVIVGDVAHSPVQVSEVDWSVEADTDAEEGRRSRRALWERVESEGLRVVAGHFPAPGFGRIVRVEGRRTWQGG